MEYETSIDYDGKKWIVLLTLNCQYWMQPACRQVGQDFEEGIGIEIEEFEAYHKGDDASWFDEDDAEVIVKADYNKIWKQWRRENE
jgi:hypothetical protein